MSAVENFFDTNVLLYLLSEEAAKADQAETLITGGGTISVQVLNEFAAVASRKLGMSLVEIRELLHTVREVCHVEPITVATHDRALAVCERYGFTIYDSLILASALLTGCEVIYTEDLGDGQVIDDRLMVQNPFRAQ